MIPETSPRQRRASYIKKSWPKDAAKHINEFKSGIKVLNGPYGPYVTDGKKNARIAKDVDPASLTKLKLKNCLMLHQLKSEALSASGLPKPKSSHRVKEVAW